MKQHSNALFNWKKGWKRISCPARVRTHDQKSETIDWQKGECYPKRSTNWATEAFTNVNPNWVRVVFLVKASGFRGQCKWGMCTFTNYCKVATLFRYDFWLLRKKVKKIPRVLPTFCSKLNFISWPNVLWCLHSINWYFPMFLFCSACVLWHSSFVIFLFCTVSVLYLCNRNVLNVSHCYDVCVLEISLL